MAPAAPRRRRVPAGAQQSTSLPRGSINRVAFPVAVARHTLLPAPALKQRGLLCAEEIAPQAAARLLPGRPAARRWGAGPCWDRLAVALISLASSQMRGRRRSALQDSMWPPDQHCWLPAAQRVAVGCHVLAAGWQR